ncbi:hypothetical protein Agub_g112 [Astrephomene gubernaculifera]|uniref:Peptide-methionine (R)-S-oxide reductase n=1 Tax=Astrephomene gubernaculifera TaxID=47775 RepID=A0AAD3DGN0_9CHLO|nr:hypothetical protein Agub_g112 [Astrephomene gubernaculifera]
MRPLFSQRGQARAVYTNATSGRDYRRTAMSMGCVALTLLALLTLALVPIARRVFLGMGVGMALVSVPMSPSSANGSTASTTTADVDVEHRQGEVRYSDEEWRRRLPSESYQVLRRGATERRWTSALNNEKRPGLFSCAGCGAPLFNTSAKFESGTGWPSFFQPLPGAVMEVPDPSLLWGPRTEVRCRRCQGHLGHVFDDGPAPTGLRYCMNGAALRFEPSGGGSGGAMSSGSGGDGQGGAVSGAA